MEATLKEILGQLQSFTKSLQSLEDGQASMQKDISVMKDDISNLKSEQAEIRSDISDMKSDITHLKSEQHEMRSDISDLKSEQREMRKEVAFYYGSMMKKLDETKTELKSEIMHISAVQKQHHVVLEYLNTKQ